MQREKVPWQHDGRSPGGQPTTSRIATEHAITNPSCTLNIKHSIFN